MDSKTYLDLKQKIIDEGFQQDVDWATNLKPCRNAFDFFVEYCFVVINSGMKAQLARPIFEKVLDAFLYDKPAAEVFGHKGKVSGLNYVWENQVELFIAYLKAEDKLSFLQSLPWIGGITKYHLAKNLGDTTMYKPDRHLVRVAEFYKTTPEILCRKISEETGDSVALVDVVIWRACNLGLIASRSLQSPD